MELPDPQIDAAEEKIPGAAGKTVKLAVAVLVHKVAVFFAVQVYVVVPSMGDLAYNLVLLVPGI